MSIATQEAYESTNMTEVDYDAPPMTEEERADYKAMIKIISEDAKASGDWRVRASAIVSRRMAKLVLSIDDERRYRACRREAMEACWSENGSSVLMEGAL